MTTQRDKDLEAFPKAYRHASQQKCWTVGAEYARKELFARLERELGYSVYLHDLKTEYGL